MIEIIKIFLFYFTQDTIVGFLLAGVGNVDIRRKTNYLIVDSSRSLNSILLTILYER